MIKEPPHATEGKDAHQGKRLWLLLLTLGAALGSWANISLSFGIDLLFGGVATLMAAFMLGPRLVLLPALVSGLWTVPLWGHPYAAIIFLAEALFVAQVCRRFRRELIVADALFWVMLGMPMIWIFYGQILDLPDVQVQLILLKQPVNGLLNALLASFILIVWSFVRRYSESGHIPFKIPLRELLMSTLVAFVLMPMLLHIVLGGHLNRQLFEQKIGRGVTAHHARFMERLKKAASGEKEVVQSDPLAELRESWITWRGKKSSLLLLDGQPGGVRHDHDKIVSRLEKVHETGVSHVIQKPLSLWLPAEGQPEIIRHQWSFLVAEGGMGADHFVVAAPLESMINMLHRDYLHHLASTLVLTLLAIVASFPVQRIIVNPLRRLGRASSRLAESANESHAFAYRPHPIYEVEELQKNFQTMLDKLESQMENLNHSNRRLSREMKERERTETRLAESELQFRVLVDTLNDGFFITNQHDVITYINKHLGKIIGYQPADLMGKKITDFIDTSYDGPSDAEFESMLGQGKTLSPGAGGITADDNPLAIENCASLPPQGKPYELPIQTSRGESRHIRISPRPLYDPLHTFSGVCAVVTDITERKQAEIDLFESREQLRALTGHLHLVREKEQKRISREIHDGLGSILTKLKMDIASMTLKSRALPPVISTPKGQEQSIDWEERFQGLTGLTDQAVQFMRRLATALRPKILDQFGLLAGLEWLAKEFEKHYHIRCVLTDDAQNVRSQEERETALFRIAQEALTNIAKHADATRAVVHLGLEEESVVMWVSDNGRGMPEKVQHHPPMSSLGIQGMRERTIQCGGTLEFESNPDGGTRLVVRVPRQESDQLEAI